MVDAYPKGSPNSLLCFSKYPAAKHMDRSSASPIMHVKKKPCAFPYTLSKLTTCNPKHFTMQLLKSFSLLNVKRYKLAYVQGVAQGYTPVRCTTHWLPLVRYV